MKKSSSVLFYLSLAVFSCPALAQDSGKVLLIDDFNRTESNPDIEEIGNGWSTNSAKRARGKKQVDLKDGAMQITRAAVADHGVSVVHEVAFTDAVIQLRFKIGAKDDLGINIADMKEKSVHAGHICVARIRQKTVELTDLKTGAMKLEHRKARQGNGLTPAMKEAMKGKSKKFPVDLDLDEWHNLTVQINGDAMIVKIDGQKVGEFRSEGIAHPTKSRLRLSVNKSAWVDDVKIQGT